MNARAKPGNVPMPAQEIGTRRFQRIPTREQREDRAGILLRRAERPSRNECVANIAIQFTTKVSHHPGEASESLREQGVESNVADALGDGGRADQIEEQNDALLLARVIIPASQEAAEDVGTNQLSDRR